jgi:hypothetical protein
VCGVVCRLGFNGPLKRIHTSDLVTTDCVSLVMMVMEQVVRNSSISIITSVRIIGTHTSTIKTLLSSSSGDSTEWRRMCQDSRSKSGRRTLTHHGNSSELRAAGFKLKEVLPPALEESVRVYTSGEGL